MENRADNEIESLEVSRRSSFTVAQLRVLVNAVVVFSTFLGYAIRCCMTTQPYVLIINSYMQNVL